MIREGWNRRVAVDVLVWLIAALLCMLWRWVSNKSEMVHYWALFGALTAAWIIVGFVVQLYRSYKDTWLWQSMVSLVLDAGILIGLCWWLLPQMPQR